MSLGPPQEHVAGWFVASVMVLLVGLFAMGFVGTAGRKTCETDYRCAGGAQDQIHLLSAPSLLTDWPAAITTVPYPQAALHSLDAHKPAKRCAAHRGHAEME